MAHTKTAKDEALKNADEGDILDTTPVAEKKPTEEVPEVKEEAQAIAGAEPETEEAETEKEVSKKGYSQRVRELVRERNQERERAQSLAERLAELTGSVEPKANFPPYTPPAGPIVSPGEEIDAYELERRLQEREQRTLQQADALAILRTKQQEAVNRINDEANEVLSLYPELDPKSEAFDKELSESVTEAVEALVQANPYSASVKATVEKMMKPYKRAVTKEVGEVTENLAKQVSEAALKPTANRPKEKQANEKTIKELEEELGIVY